MSNIKPGFKLFVLLIAVGLLIFGAWKAGWIGQGTEASATENSASTERASTSSTDADGVTVVRVGVVTFPGYAGGQYFNKGFLANAASGFFEAYGYKVEFVLIDDVAASRNAFINNNVDVLWATMDSYPTESGALFADGAKVIFQSDWSRGADAIVAYSDAGINTMKDLRGKKVAVCPMSPSHSFLLMMLESANMTIDDIQVVEMPSAIDAANAFRSGVTEAAVVWAPDDLDCIRSARESGREAIVVVSTKTSTNIIADVFIAKDSYIQNNRSLVVNLVEGWMKGAAELNTNPKAREETAEILRTNLEGFGSKEDALKLMQNVRYATIGDNANFFGISDGFTGVTGRDLYETMVKKYTDAGIIKGSVPSWSQIVDKTIVKEVYDRLKDQPGHQAEGQKEFSAPTAADRTKVAVASKSVSVYFETGSFKLSPASKSLIQREFEMVAKTNANARIRIVGNTDAVGNTESNRTLSKQRAQAVADYISSAWDISRNRLVVIGNGPKKANEDGVQGASEEYRRTDFELLVE